jgi:hypothetical protein
MVLLKGQTMQASGVSIKMMKLPMTALCPAPCSSELGSRVVLLQSRCRLPLVRFRLIFTRSHVITSLMFNCALPTMLRLDYNPRHDCLETCSRGLQCVTHVCHPKTSLFRAPRGDLEQPEHIRSTLLLVVSLSLSYNYMILNLHFRPIAAR